MEELLKYLKYYLDVNVPTIWDDEGYTIPLTVANVYEVIRDKHKLILRPLSDLTKEIPFKGETIDVLEEIYSESWMACGFIVKKRKTFIEIISKEDSSVIKIQLDKPQCNEVWINEILVKFHFDVFELIEKGCAVDVNTIKQKNYI